MANTAINTTLQKLSLVDLQFSGQYDATKFQQLVQALVTAETTVNALIEQFNALVTQIGSDTSVPKHELAGETGLGPAHTVSALIAGQVLVATGATAAEFAKLQFSQMAQADPNSIDQAIDGDFLGLVNGFWSAVPGTSMSGANPNLSYLTGNPEGLLPQSRQLTAGTNISLDTGTAKKLIINAAALLPGDLGFVLTGNGAANQPSYQFPQDSFYTTYAGAA